MRRVIMCLAAVVLSMCAVAVSYGGELTAGEAIVHYQQGVKAQKAYNFDAAEMEYKKVFMFDPNNTMWKTLIANNRGIMYAQQGQLDLAEVSFNEALKYDPSYKAAQYNLGFVYEKKRSKLESLEYWMKMLNIDIESAKPQGFVIDSEPPVVVAK